MNLGILNNQYRAGYNQFQTDYWPLLVAGNARREVVLPPILLAYSKRKSTVLGGSCNAVEGRERLVTVIEGGET